MDFKQLEYFLAIYEEGSISKAAEKLFISQQGLSKAILALEQELDCKLFHRKPKGVVLTDAGETFLTHTKNMLAVKKETMDDMAAFREHERLSVAMVIGARFSLPKGIFKGFLSQHPELDFTLQELKNENCFYHVEQDKADLAIVVQTKNHPNYYYYPIKKEPFAMIVPTDHPLAQKEQIFLDDLNGLPLAVFAENNTSALLEQCKEKGIQLSKIYETPGIVALYQTCSDLGILGVSLDSLKGKLAFPNLKLIPIHEEEVCWNITLTYKKSKKQTKIAQEFEEYLKKRL